MIGRSAEVRQTPLYGNWVSISQSWKTAVKIQKTTCKASLYDMIFLSYWGVLNYIFMYPGKKLGADPSLELSRTLPRRFDRVIRSDSCPYQSGRTFARGVVLESKTEGSMRKCALFVFLHTRFCLCTLCLPGVCCTASSLDGCRSQWRDRRWCSSGSMEERVRT